MSSLSVLSILTLLESLLGAHRGTHEALILGTLLCSVQGKEAHKDFDQRNPRFQGKRERQEAPQVPFSHKLWVGLWSLEAAFRSRAG